MGNIYEYLASDILLVEYWYLYSSGLKQTNQGVLSMSTQHNVWIKPHPMHGYLT